MITPIVKPVNVKEYEFKQSEYDVAPRLPFRLSYCKYKSLFFTENFRIFMMRKFRLSVLGKL